MPSATVKAAYMRVVPETNRRGMETQVDVDKVEPHNLEDKVLASIRSNTSGTAPMDVGNICRSWQFQSEYHVKFTRGFGQLPRSQQL